jgi:hypothetical protein
MNKFVRFEMGDRLVCIKEYESLKVGSHYRIKGCGDLTWNSVSNKDGYGFCIEDDQYGYHSGRKDWWNLPYNEKIKWYYFTEQEMSEYFISEQEDYKSYLRNEKLKQLGV